MWDYKVNYFACIFSVLAALFCALNGHLILAAVNWGFAIYNWYIAGWMKEKQEKNEDNESDE